MKDIKSLLLEHVNNDFNIMISYCNEDNRLGNGWSLHEILEHITLTNHFLLKLIDKLFRKRFNVEPLIEFKKVEIESILNEFKWDNPIHHTPLGYYNEEFIIKYELNGTHLDNIKQVLIKQQEYLINILYEVKGNEGYTKRIKQTVNNIGYLNLFEYIYFLIMHIHRHYIQINKLN